MGKLSIRFSLLLLLGFTPFLFFGSQALAADYYVSTTGSDTNLGIQSQPWRTIQKAADSAQPGDKVHIGPGIFYERVKVNVSGNSTSGIVFQGQRGDNGEFLTVIDGSDVTSGWEADPEHSPPCTASPCVYTYKTDAIEYNSYAMVIKENGDVYDIPRLSWKPGTEYEGFIFLAYAPNLIVTTNYEHLDVNYWDGIEALYYPVFNSATGKYTTYIRFKNGDDPNSKIVRSSPNGACFTLNNKHYITLRDIKTQGARYGVLITNNASHNVIDSALMITGQARVMLSEGASFNHVRNTENHMNGLSVFKPGAWNAARFVDDPARRYQEAVQEHIYWVYKHEVGEGTYSPDDDCGIKINNIGPGNEIYDNKIYNSLSAVINSKVPEGLKIYRNEIYGISSGALGGDNNNYDLEIFDNLIYDAGLRIQDMEKPDKRIYIYRNKIWNYHRQGDNLYFHFGTTTPTGQYPEVWVYHNTFVGGYWGTTISNLADNYSGMPKVFFLNNIYSIDPSIVLLGYYPVNMGSFDYNWAGGRLPTSLPSWFGEHNIVGGSQQLFADETMPNFIPPKDSLARNTGLDLSRPFTLKGITYPALPGMKPGYFAGEQPDMGAVQTGIEPTSSPSPSPVCPGDLNTDGVVNLVDLAAVLSAWGSTIGAADTNTDGVVNLADIAFILSKWGRCL